MSKKAIITSVLLSIIAAYATVKITAPDTVALSTKETAFDRVMRTKTLRCGYGIWAPGLTKDAQTGKLSGIFYDYLEAIGQHTGLKIDWVGEIGWGDYPTALTTGRVDAMCFGAWPKAILSKQVLFTKPTYFLPIRAYVRSNDTRFDNNLTKANNPDVVISTMDAELSSQIAQANFSQAKTLSLPQLTDASMLLLNVANKKADITFTDAWTAASFMAQNPNQLKAVENVKPLRLFGHTIPIAQGEHNLLHLINTAHDEIMTSGEFEEIMAKYNTGTILILNDDYK